tara:strand:- start:7725 stop:9020 length:1296 start_codon:yes stop_codon:yes gene_type:complete
MYIDKLQDKINSKEAVVGIIGLGYVGLPLALQILAHDFKVIGYDSDDKKVNYLLNKKSYIKTVSDEDLNTRNNKNFLPTSTIDDMKDVDIFIICVPTPLDNSLSPDLTYITSSREVISKVIKKGSMVSLESTTYPGCTQELLGDFFSNDMIIGESIFIGYSPEREDPGNVDFSTGNIPKVVSGLTESCCNLMNSFYSTFITTTVVVSSTKTAEMVKLLENIYRSVNIGLINEMKIIADKFGVDIFEVVDAAATKPFGYNAFYPGPGLGGHCIPVDPFYLSWKAKEFGYNAKFIELSGEINRDMPKYVLEKITKVLNINKKSINDANILILGVSYKKDIDDTRETPAKDIFELLEDSGAIINYHDPYVASFSSDKIEYLNSELSITNLKKADIVVLVTNHTVLDYEFIYEHSKSILDTRGQYSIKLKKVHRG